MQFKNNLTFASCILEVSELGLFLSVESPELGFFCSFLSVSTNIKVKVSRNRPGVAQSVPGVLGSQIP
jgi:hypothetical protein